MRETIPSVGVSQWRHEMGREARRPNKTRQKAITRLENRKRESKKTEKSDV